jgi:hypothetical protein
MWSKVSILVLMVCSVLAIASCKTTHVGGTADCPKRSYEELIELLNAKSITTFSDYSAKISINVKDSKSNNSFKTTLRMRTDSAFAGVMKVAGIIGAGYYGDKDSIIFTNKLKKCFVREDYKTLSQKFGMDLNYNLMEELILGKPFGLSTVEELMPLKDEGHYTLASHDKKAFARLEAGSLEEGELEDVFVQYKLNCETLNLAQILINVPSMLSSVSIIFVKRQDVSGLDFPEETEIKIITPLDSTFISLSYDVPELNDPKTVSISIPDSYNACE